MKSFVMNIWNKIPDKFKIKIISAFNTAGSVFLLTIAASLIADGHIVWNIAFFGGLISAGVREAFKAVVNSFVSKRLGGRK
ncbi:MAG: hypothetical protein V4469_04565 [Patescibacteria group bacterium]